jgi:hypothetical protein
MNLSFLFGGSSSNSGTPLVVGPDDPREADKE